MTIIKNLIQLLVFGLILFVLNGCSTSISTMEPSQTVIPKPTNTPTPMVSRTPSASPVPTLTTQPTKIPRPTSTPTPAVYSSYTGLVPSGALARLGKGRIETITLSPGGDQLAVATVYGVYLYRIDSMEEIWRFEGQGFPTCLKFSPDGEILAIGTSGGDIYLLSTSGGEELRSWQVPGEDQPRGIYFMSFLPDKDRLVSVSQSSITLWDWTNAQPLLFLQHHYISYSYTAALSPDGKTLALGSHNTIQLWDLEAGELERLFTFDVSFANVFEGGAPPGVSTCLVFSPDGKRLLSGHPDIRIWDLESGRLILDQSIGDGADAMVFSPDGAMLATAIEDGLIQLWDVQSGKELFRHFGWQYSGHQNILFTPDGKTLITNSDYKVYFWNLPSGALLRTLEGFVVDREDLSFLSDEKVLSTFDGTLNLDHFQLVQSLYRSDYVSPNGDLLADSSESTLILKDSKSGEVRRQLTLDENIIDEFFSLDGKTLVTILKTKILIWDLPALVDSQETLPRLEFPYREEFIPYKAISWDGKAMITWVYEDEDTIWWDLTTGQRYPILAGYNGIKALAFSPDGRTIAFSQESWSLGDIIIWDLRTKAPSGFLYGHFGSVDALAFSPDGEFLASYSSNDTTAVIWDMNIPIPSSQTTSSSIPAPEQKLICNGIGQILKMVFSPSGDRLTIVSNTGIYSYQKAECNTIWRWPEEISEFDLERIAISSDGSMVAASNYIESDEGIWLWNVLTKERRFLHEGYADGLAFTPDGRTLLIGYDWNHLIFWDLTANAPVREVESDDLSGTSIMIISGGIYLSYSREWSDLKLLDLQKEKAQVVEIQAASGNDPNLTQAISPGNQILAVTFGEPDSDNVRGRMNMIDLQNRWLFFDVFETLRIESLAFSSDGGLLAAGYYNGTIDLFIGAVTWDSVRFQGFADELYPLTIGFRDFMTHDIAVTSLTFSHDGSVLAAGSADGNVILIKLASPKKPDPDDLACSLQFGEEVHPLQGSNLWFEPDVNASISTSVLPEKELYILLGPKWAPILKGSETSGWFWKVSYTPGGPSVGWIWEGRLEECQ